MTTATQTSGLGGISSSLRAENRSPSLLRRTLPNWLTASRVVVAAVFFGVLTIWRWEDSAASRGQIDWLLLTAAALFIVAVVTDALDGYLARKWQVESTFGRIMDPFADKILIVGAFVFLAGPDFWFEFPPGAPTYLSGHGLQLSGVYPWMVVVIMARELLVTSIRGVMEAQGVKFASDWWGKGKMILQSFAIPTVIAIMALFPVLPRITGTVIEASPPGRMVVDWLVYLMMGVTIISGVPYVLRAWRIMSDERRARSDS